MTTVACDGKSISADGMINSGGIVHDLACWKIFRLGNGDIVGLAGQPFFHATVLEYLEGRLKDIDVGNDFEGIILKRDGQCYCMDGRGRKYLASVPAAAGSGATIALAAMALGKTAKEAVELAAKLDVYTGGEIRTLERRA